MEFRRVLFRQAARTDRARDHRHSGPGAMSRAIIVGSGFGGLALGIRLQSAGVETVIVEARAKPGGRASSWEPGGFTFDAGATVISYPDGLREPLALYGRRMAVPRTT